MVVKLDGDHHINSFMSCRPTEFTCFHDNILELYCKVEPDHIKLSDIFDSVQLYSGGPAFPNPKVRRFASNRRQTIKRRVQLPHKVFVESEFYPFCEQNRIIDTLLALQQSSSGIRTTMSRITRSRGKTARDDESTDDGDFMMEEDDMMLSAAAGLRNLNLGTSTSRTRSNR